MAKPVNRGPALVELRLGQLPIIAINRTLRLELEAGEVVFSVPAQIHARKSHPNDFPRCLPYTGTVVTSPLFVGDDFQNEGKIELIARISALMAGLLVAISIEPNENGCYNVTSLYPVSEKKILGRLEKRFLKRVL